MSEYLKVDLQNLVYAMLRQYKSKSVLIREAIQNAVDAGAKNINITIQDRLIKVDDDGYGMDLNNIKEYWNTLARTSKRDQKGVIGEFGLGRLTFLLVSERMFMETCKDETSYRVLTDRSGHVSIEKGERLKKGTSVWVDGNFSDLKLEFIEYAREVAKARLEQIEVNGQIVSKREYAAPSSTIFQLSVDEKNIKGVLWLPVDIAKGKQKERDAVIRLYVNDLFVKEIATDYYVFGEVDCGTLSVVTSRDDVVDDEKYQRFYVTLLDLIETKFYPAIASNQNLVNDARVKNDILRAASKRGDKTLIENMIFETTSGEKVTGDQILAKNKVFVVSETNPTDMELGDTFHKLGEGMSVIAPIGLKRILDRTIGTIERSEVAETVRQLTIGEPASSKEAREFEKVGEIVTLLSGYKVEFRKNMAAEAEHILGTIIINIDSPIFKEAKLLIDNGWKNLAMVRLIGIVAHEMAHQRAGVHDVEFYKNFESLVSQLEAKIINLLKGR